MTSLSLFSLLLTQFCTFSFMEVCIELVRCEKQTFEGRVV
ncbi:hypothetical protein GLYMA_11G022266v4 [Glycine max]|nr:hypothetical protein GLYMA_11G022266v4 [Glycine max]KAH1157179.1 hypothetical protein GYH30_029791 [Glycine max]